MKLYKYRKFNEFLLQELCNSKIYYSDPNNFNDPLDSSPILLDDLDEKHIETLCSEILVQNIGEPAASEKLELFSYNSEELDKPEEIRNSYIFQLKKEIKTQLDNMIKGKGVVSLSSRVDSPLMWSHYADEHKGVCLEFDVNTAVERPYQVSYDGTRGISSKLVYDYIINQSELALKKIKNQYFYVKANEWKYESEWRLLSDTCGLQSAPYKLSGIYFGMRCNKSVIISIIKLLYSTSSNISFYKLETDENSFELHYTELEPQEYISCVPKPSVKVVFSQIKV